MCNELIQYHHITSGVRKTENRFGFGLKNQTVQKLILNRIQVFFSKTEQNFFKSILHITTHNSDSLPMQQSDGCLFQSPTIWNQQTL